jgi:hypothetical protein
MENKKMSNKKEDWMQSKWRPAMGWLYMLTCAFDFVIFPVLWSILQAVTKAPITQWNPLTLQGAGLYHLAMGAVLGVAAWSRGQEKMAGAAGTPVGTPAASTNFGTGASASTGGWGSPAPAATPTPAPAADWGTPAAVPAATPPAPAPAATMSTPAATPPVSTKQGVRFSNNPTARVVIADEPAVDADSKIK